MASSPKKKRKLVSLKFLFLRFFLKSINFRISLLLSYKELKSKSHIKFDNFSTNSLSLACFNVSLNFSFETRKTGAKLASRFLAFKLTLNSLPLKKVSKASKRSEERRVGKECRYC